MVSSDEGDYTEDYYLIGDLVVFTGDTYSPDYVYVEQYIPARRAVGIVVATVNGYYQDVLYRVYWLKTGRITQVASVHIKLLYAQK
jgi:hypothetical protein